MLWARLRLLRRLGSRRGTLLFALLWFGSWVFLNGLVLVQRRLLSDYCTDDKSRRILRHLVSLANLLSGRCKHWANSTFSGFA